MLTKINYQGGFDIHSPYVTSRERIRYEEAQRLAHVRGKIPDRDEEYELSRAANIRATQDAE